MRKKGRANSHWNGPRPDRNILKDYHGTAKLNLLAHEFDNGARVARHIATMKLERFGDLMVRKAYLDDRIVELSRKRDSIRAQSQALVLQGVGE